MAVTDEAVSHERRDAVLSLLERESARWRRRRRVVYWLVGGLVTWWSAAWVARWLGSSLWPFGREPGWLDTFVQLVGTASPGLTSIASRRHRRLLMVINDVSSVGPLLEGLSMTGTGVRTWCIGALAELLPRVNADSAPPLTADQRSALAWAAAWDGYPEALRLAALEAMRFVGDRKCLKAVESLTVRGAPTAADRRVRERAKRVLPEVRDAAQRVETVDRLLRPAEPPSESTLLRPAEGGPMGDETLLVRPVAVDLGPHAGGFRS